MNLFSWMTRAPRREQQKLRDQWRERWSKAVDAEQLTELETLSAQLPLLQSADADVEVELEMLEALERLAPLTANPDLPEIETHHRVAAGERCHFTAPASLENDGAQTSGRVLFTASRTLFVGGGASTAGVPWHAVREAIRLNRDLLLARGDGSAAAHYRFNTYGDAVLAVSLARRLKGGARQRGL